MKVHDLAQGSPEWLAYRAQHFNASDAPAMMGLSPYKTRTQLLHEMHTGFASEVDEVTQRLFNDGHRFEALARPLAEKIIGEDLYPVVGSKGKLSMSSDGLTMDQKKGFEHKTLNDELRACMRQQGGNANDFLPLIYKIQMEQQCMVADSEVILFMASKWNGDELVEERHCWYTPDAELRAQILMGWEQFEKDLSEYAPPPITMNSMGRTPETLPALHIEVTGQVTASNLAAFKETALAAIRSVKRELSTDQDFADADASVKWCSDVESRLAAAKEHALSQTASIDALFKAIDDISAEARKVRLDLEKLVKARKDQIRMEIVSEAVAKGNEHIRTLNERIGKPLMPTIPADYAGVIKNKRTLASLRDSVDTELARFKIAANEIADRITLNVRTIEAAEHDHLFPDLQVLTLKQPDDLAAVIAQRVAKYKQQAAAPMAQGVQDVIAVGTGITKLSEVTRFAPEAVHDSGERIKLGDINARLAPIQITADGLAQLGFKHVASDKAAKLYRESDFTNICDVLIKVIGNAKWPVGKVA